ncbi:MAG: hypothetical protein L0Y75_01035 [Acidobacteria bacterium]|nr:hypothetical protein [Acidobacteriota bacterium]
MFDRLTNKVVNCALALAVALILGVTVFAQGGDKQKIEFYLDGKVGNEVVKKGSYTVVIPEAEQGAIEIKVGKKVVTAQVTKRQNNNEADADKMTYRDNGDGTRTIATITPRGRKFTLVLQENAGSVAGGNQQ